jgi:hypothetical protein
LCCFYFSQHAANQNERERQGQKKGNLVGSVPAKKKAVKASGTTPKFSRAKGKKVVVPTLAVEDNAPLPSSSESDDSESDDEESCNDESQDDDESHEQQDLITIPFHEHLFKRQAGETGEIVRHNSIEVSPESSYADVKRSIQEYLDPWNSRQLQIFLDANNDNAQLDSSSTVNSKPAIPIEPDETETALTLFGNKESSPRFNLRVYCKQQSFRRRPMMGDIGIFIPDDSLSLSQHPLLAMNSLELKHLSEHYSSMENILAWNQMLSTGNKMENTSSLTGAEKDGTRGVRGDTGPKYVYQEHVEALKPELLQTVKTYIEDLYTSAMASHAPTESLPTDMHREDDFKVYLTFQQLHDLIGFDAVQTLESVLVKNMSEIGLKSIATLNSFNSHRTNVSDYEIILRRCAARDQFIPFHFDRSALLTLQVALNDERDYEGGRLIYLTERAQGKEEEAETGGHAGRRVVWSQPHRNAGSILIHGSNILHGVSKMGSGVRYALFLLYKPQPHSVAVDGVVSG